MAAAKWEHLHCEYEPKPHNWKRELGKRGRKPRFCDKHKPVPVASNSTVTTQPNGMRVLHCANGNHDWERVPTRGRTPVSCPAHTVKLIIVPANRNENGKVTLHCEAGNHDWERAPKKGRKPVSCPEHSAPRAVGVNIVAGSGEGSGIPAPKKPGRPKLYDTKEEAQEAADKRSRERAKNLDAALMDAGKHLSQNYILYRKTGEKPSRNGAAPATTWEKVTAHTALQSAQYVNAHEADFQNELYRYEKDNKVLNLL